MANYKKLHLLSTFYLSFCIPTLIITLSCAFFIYHTGAKGFPLTIWFKVISLGIIAWYMNEYKHKEFFYYRNLGISKRFLWICTLSFDLLLFAFTLFFVCR